MVQVRNYSKKKYLGYSMVYSSVYLSWLVKVLSSFCQESVSIQKAITINIHLDDLVKVCYFLRNNTNCQFKVLTDITCVDFPFRQDKRFDVVYQLLSVLYNSRLTLKVSVSSSIKVNSIVQVFKGANWFEREVFDLFGIYFKGHPDLRRLLTDYGFEGFPLRKDFPLTGFVEVRYSLDKNRVVCEPLEMAQEFKGFKYVLPERFFIDKS